MLTGKKIWVYVELQRTIAQDTSNYFYYGQVSERVIEKIENNPEAKGVFILSDIRFWNDDDLLELYEDTERFGFKAYRLQDIQHISSFKKDPVFIFKPEELHESAKRLRLLD